MSESLGTKTTLSNRSKKLESDKVFDTLGGNFPRAMFDTHHSPYAYLYTILKGSNLGILGMSIFISKLLFRISEINLAF